MIFLLQEAVSGRANLANMERMYGLFNAVAFWGIWAMILGFLLCNAIGFVWFCKWLVKELDTSDADADAHGALSLTIGGLLSRWITRLRLAVAIRK